VIEQNTPWTKWKEFCHKKTKIYKKRPQKKWRGVLKLKFYFAQ